MARISKSNINPNDIAFSKRFTGKCEIVTKRPVVDSSSKKINYFMATWSGQRAKTQFDDSHLKKHIAQLNRVKHNLSQITIGYPRNPDVTPEYHKYILGLKQLDDGTPIVVIPMPNLGISYGQYSRMYELCRNRFDYYIFVEDDYVPVLDEFDLVLVNMLDALGDSCGLLCGVVYDDQPGRYNKKIVPRHAAVSNGIATSASLEKIRRRLGELFPQNSWGGDAQVKFSQNFLKSGLQILDYVDQYPVKYYSHDKGLWIFQEAPDDPPRPDIFIPSQCLDLDRLWTVEWRFKTGLPVTKNNVRLVFA